MMFVANKLAVTNLKRRNILIIYASATGYYNIYISSCSVLSNLSKKGCTLKLTRGNMKMKDVIRIT